MYDFSLLKFKPEEPLFCVLLYRSAAAGVKNNVELSIVCDRIIPTYVENGNHGGSPHVSTAFFFCKAYIVVCS